MSDAVWLDEPCENCGSLRTYKQYNDTIGETVYGCDDCGRQDF
jgi:hypothetical protein